MSDACDQNAASGEDADRSAIGKRAAAFATGNPATEDVTQGNPNPVRDAGPENMRDEDGDNWDIVDEGSDESFPASDPPCYSVPKSDPAKAEDQDLEAPDARPDVEPDTGM